MEDSKPSAPSASKSTGKTEDDLSPSEALEILSKALQICEKAGISTRLAPFFAAGEQQTIIVLGSTRINEKRLEYTGNQAA